MFGTLLSLAPGLSLIVIGFFINACGFFFTHSLAAGWRGVVVGSLLILGVTLGIALWLGGRERKRVNTLCSDS